ncbi:glycosyltransferase family 2 protein [uncultured Veillonella sp.]|uniref:glycosyltransferase family 2 protein n=1 Tax=uncultured Veillonella sp. TaxID=159268 RepID=UPI00260AEFC4|nr:glycosyltransferase family 2 protein [uncultured Veillonella sp.]
MATVSVIILARNEEHNIHDCIESVQFADEVLVIDDFSTDKTLVIAQELGARVIQHLLNGDWAQQRRFGVSQSKCDWVLFLDADERISNSLAKEIQEVISDNSKKSYWIQRSNKFQHNHATHGVLRPDYVLRLMPKDGVTIEGTVHESISSLYPSEKLQHSMYHYTYDNWHQYFNKFNNYTTLSAEKYRDNGKSCSFIKDIILRPTWAFIKVYFLQGGILDGKMGFILSVNHYFYTMTKYVKFYYLLKSKGKL